MRKRILSSILTVCMVIGMVVVMPTAVGAATEGLYTYGVLDGEAYINKCDTSVSGDVTIPSTLGGYPVTEINPGAFYGCSSLESVTIPDSVITIGTDAFNGCSSLSNVTIGNGVTTIGRSAFANCTGINSVTIPNSITTIGSNAFDHCSNLLDVTIGNNVTTIGSNAFNGCSRLNSVTIPDSVITIGVYAFFDCTGLNNVTIGNNVTTISDGAFEGCTGLNSVFIPATVTNIGAYAFGGYPVNIVIDDDNPSYCVSDGHIFSKDMTRLIRYDIRKTATEFTIPSTVTTVGVGAFSEAKVTTITIPASVHTIDEEGFGWCSITSIDIPATVQTINSSAFDGCESLESINVAAENPNYSSDTGVVYNKDKTELLIYPYGNTASSYSLPASVTTIPAWFFYWNNYIETVILSNTLLSIGEGAFYDSALQTVLYMGTEQQWQEIDIDSENDALTNANVVFEYDGNPPRITAVSCLYDGDSGKISAEVRFNYLLEAGDLVLAIYDNQMLIDVKTKALTLEDSRVPFEFDADDSYLGYTAKAFYWDSTNKFMPLTDSVEAQVSLVPIFCTKKSTGICKTCRFNY